MKKIAMIMAVLVSTAQTAFAFEIDTVCLKALNVNKYVSSEPEQNHRWMRANRDWCREWEYFTIVRFPTSNDRIQHGDKITVRTFWDKYWFAEPGRVLLGNNDGLGGRNTEFTILREDGPGEIRDGDIVGIKDYRGRFVRRLGNPAENGRLNMHEVPNANPIPGAARFTYNIVSTETLSSGGGNIPPNTLPPPPIENEPGESGEPPQIITSCYGQTIPPDYVVFDDRRNANCPRGVERILTYIGDLASGTEITICMGYDIPQGWTIVSRSSQTSVCAILFWVVVGYPEGTPNTARIRKD